MDIIYLLKIFNCCFILTGNGSARLIKITWMLKSYVWRFALISIFLINVYNGTKWALNNVMDILEPISIVLIASVQLKLLGPLFSILWRLYFDKELSNVLKKCMDMLDVLKNFKSGVVLRTKIFWIFIVCILIHFMVHVTAQSGFIYKTPNYSVFNTVIWSCIFTYNRFMFYEYMILITFFQIIVYKLNDEISKGKIPISQLAIMYTSTMENLDLINRFIFGAPVLINIIMGTMCNIVYISYHYVLFKGLFIKYDVHFLFPILHLSMKLFDISILYYLCQTTEKEINRTISILNKRSITENLTVRRKIAFFSLQRLHANFHFELCGFHKINLRQFLSLLFKTAIFLVIQIQLNIKTISQSFN